MTLMTKEVSTWTNEKREKKINELRRSKSNEPVKQRLRACDFHHTQMPLFSKYKGIPIGQIITIKPHSPSPVLTNNYDILSADIDELFNATNIIYSKLCVNYSKVNLTGQVADSIVKLLDDYFGQISFCVNKLQTTFFSSRNSKDMLVNVDGMRRLLSSLADSVVSGVNKTTVNNIIKCIPDLGMLSTIAFYLGCCIDHQLNELRFGEKTTEQPANAQNANNEKLAMLMSKLDDLLNRDGDKSVGEQVAVPEHKYSTVAKFSYE